MSAIEKYSGTVREPTRASAMLRGAWHDCHLVSPETACPFLADGWELAFSRVEVSIERETYLITGWGQGDDDRPSQSAREPKDTDWLGLNRFALDRIARAADVSWDPRESKRMDDASDPHYCRYQAVGTFPNFNGERLVTLDEKEIDLRDGSDYIENIRARAAAKRPKPRDPEPQIRNERANILSFCITKAMNRAIRRLGVRTHYTRKELERPFIVVRAIFTGRTDNPELARVFAERLAMRGAPAYGALYAGAALPQPDPARIADGAKPAPPIDQVPPDEDDRPSAIELYCEYCGRLDFVTVRQTPDGEIRFCDQQACMDCAWGDAHRSFDAARMKRAHSLPKVTVRAHAAPAEQVPPRGPLPRAQETAANSPNAGGVRATTRSAGSKPASFGQRDRPERRPSTSPAPTPARGASAPATSNPHPDVAAGGASNRPPSGHKIPYGPEKDIPIEVASTGALADMIEWIRRRLREGRTPAKFVAADERLLTAMLTEYDLRATQGDVLAEGEDKLPFG